MEHGHPVPGIVPRAASSRDYAPGFTVDLMCKDLGLAVNAARELRVPVAVSSAAQQVLRMASSQGYGQEGRRVRLCVPQGLRRRRARVAPARRRSDRHEHRAGGRAGGAPPSRTSRPSCSRTVRGATSSSTGRRAGRRTGSGRGASGPATASPSPAQHPRVRRRLPGRPEARRRRRLRQRDAHHRGAGRRSSRTRGPRVVFTVEALWPRLAPLAGDGLRRDRVVICEGEVDGLTDARGARAPGSPEALSRAGHGPVGAGRDPLHVGDDGPPEGRDAEPRQRRVERLSRSSATCAWGRRTACW